MKNKTKKSQQYQDFDYNPKQKDIPMLEKLIKKLEFKDKEKYFHQLVDKEGKYKFTNIFFFIKIFSLKKIPLFIK